MTGLLRTSQKAKAKALGNKERQNQNPRAYAVVCLDTDDVVIDRMTPKPWEKTGGANTHAAWPTIMGRRKRRSSRDMPADRLRLQRRSAREPRRSATRTTLPGWTAAG